MTKAARSVESAPRSVVCFDSEPANVQMHASVEFHVDGICVYRMQYTGKGRAERINSAEADWVAGEKGWVRRILDSTETREKVRDERLAREAEAEGVKL